MLNALKLHSARLVFGTVEHSSLNARNPCRRRLVFEADDICLDLHIEQKSEGVISSLRGGLDV